MNEHHHENHDPVTCADCGKTCSTPSSLAHHSYKHKERNCQCGTCQESFAFKSELNEHEFLHRTGRSFICVAKNCGKSFKTEPQLKKHVKVHDGIKWECDFCKYTHTDRRNVIQHEIRHTTKTPVAKASDGLLSFNATKRGTLVRPIRPLKTVTKVRV